MSTLTKSDKIALDACERSSDCGMCFHPGSPLAGSAGHLVDAGLITRNHGPIGGFSINENGRRMLVAIRAARLLHRARKATVDG
jgi:hypothetical protein